MRHATPEEIVAFRDGEQVGGEAERHIRSCPLCRRQLGEARWVRTHTISHLLRAEGPEPTRDEVAGYLDEALDEKEMDRVETHIRTNDKLLAVFDKLLMMSLKLKDPLPDSGKVDDLKAQLRGPRLLGRLRVFVTDRFKQVFHPSRSGEPAHARAVKMLLDEGKPLPCMAVTETCLAHAEMCEDRAMAPPPELKPSNPRVIDTGQWLIRAVTSGSSGEAMLELVIEETETGQPVPKVRLKLDPDWADPVFNRTDEKGSARFPLPEGDSRLEIGDEPELVIEINAEFDPQ